MLTPPPHVLNLAFISSSVSLVEKTPQVAVMCPSASALNSVTLVCHLKSVSK